jgi:AraC family transcriptional regulator of adaptative response/methylated-DNA-[protein]-cysteine methyltransferase
MAYATAHRAKRIRQELSNSSSVTQAIFDAGYNSSGRFYEESGALLGMTPTAYKAGGENTTIYFAIGDCFLGSILVAQSSKGVCAILMGDDPGELLRDLQDRFPRAELKGGDQDFEQVIAQVISYIEEPGQGLSLPLDIRGTSFQQRVWQALREIPPGQTKNWSAQGRPCCCQRLCRKRPSGGNSMPPSGAQRWLALGLPVGSGAQTYSDRTRSSEN